MINSLKDWIESQGVAIAQTQPGFDISTPGLDIKLVDFTLNTDEQGFGRRWITELQAQTPNRSIFIFEDEWKNKRNICESRLLHCWGKSTTTCYAREVQLAPLTASRYSEFMNHHHIQGSVRSPIKIGAFHGIDLVGAAGFGAMRANMGSKSTPGHFEMLRFATLGSVPGLAGKIIKRFLAENHVDVLTSYCDLRWGQGGLYRGLGFSEVSKPGNNYWYLDAQNQRHYRYKFTKHSLVAKGHSKDSTEREIMTSLGYRKVWDAGCLKFQLIP